MESIRAARSDLANLAYAIDAEPVCKIPRFVPAGAPPDSTRRSSLKICIAALGGNMPPSVSRPFRVVVEAVSAYRKLDPTMAVRTAPGSHDARLSRPSRHLLKARKL
jgi:hypothetical protein